MISREQTTSGLRPPASLPPAFALLIFAKYPEPGKVKTRLAASLGAVEAAALYRQFVEKILQTGYRSGAQKVFVTMAPADRITAFRDIFPGIYTLFPQIDSPDLGQRIVNAASRVMVQGYANILIIGTDSPSLPLTYIHEAHRALEGHDLVIGPADDGGYYLIGFSKLRPGIFEGISWSTPEVFSQTLARARELHLRVQVLPMWYDVDDLPSFRRLVQDHPEFSR